MARVARGVDIDIYSDVVCPWCYIGERRLEAALDRFDGDVTIRYRPFQLDPSTPKDGRPLLSWLAPKFGGEARVRAITRHTTDLAAAVGLELHYDTAIIANTFDAHRLIWFAGDELGARMADVLHRAHFTDGLDIGSIEVLTSLAVEVGLDKDAVRAFLASDDGKADVQAEIDRAHQMGISSVPTFILAGKYAVVGAQEPGTLLEALQEVARRESATPLIQPIAGQGESCTDDSCAV